MLNKTDLVKVTNRGRGRVGYTVPDMGIRRQFMPHETKEVSMEELRSLSYMPGGYNIIKNYLVVENAEAVEELFGEVEPEYNYTEDDVRYLLTNGTLDQLLDCLDFAPTGVIDLIKSLAVELKVNDVQKRKAILEKTGFNVDKAIEIEEETAEADEEKKKSERRAPAITEEEVQEAEPQRRSSIPKYKVVES